MTERRYHHHFYQQFKKHHFYFILIGRFGKTNFWWATTEEQQRFFGLGRLTLVSLSCAPSFPSPFTHAFESCHFRRATLLSIYSSVRNLFPLPDGGGSVTTAHRTYDDEDKNDDDGGGVNEGCWGSDRCSHRLY